MAWGGGLGDGSPPGLVSLGGRPPRANPRQVVCALRGFVGARSTVVWSRFLFSVSRTLTLAVEGWSLVVVGASCCWGVSTQGILCELRGVGLGVGS